MSIRRATVSGQFYPNIENELNRYFEHFENILQSSEFDINNYKIKPKAIVVPHAGYMYSGFTASVAYQVVSKFDYKRVIVIGPSHKVAFEGISISEFDTYETPIKDLDIDTKYIETLKSKFNFQFFESVHMEHSTETQAPFVKKYLDKPVIEMIYSQYKYEELAKIVDFLLQDSDNLVIISTDLSHYYDIEQANELDHNCLQAMIDLDVDGFESCEACGITGVKALVNSANKNNLELDILDYRTSADASGDSSSVVGYSSAIIF
jgi:AmmeMemoRadiSam system protein B